MLSSNSIENYTLEIISRGQSIQDRCDCYVSREYINDAPINLSRTIKKMCVYLSKVAKTIFIDTNWEDKDDNESGLDQLRNTDRLIQELGEHLCYIDMARNENLPWSIIPSFESMVKNLLPNTEVMLLPEWEYNYTVDLRDLRSFYEDILKAYRYIEPTDPNILSALENPFHIITFPLLERKNMRLHALLGHELGHLLVDSFLTQDMKDKFLESISDEIDRLVADRPEVKSKDLELLRPVIIKELKSDLTQEAGDYWQSGLEEILSDIVGALMFGPAALFSCFDIAIQQSLDMPPSASNSYYPPWRMRLREVINVLNLYGKDFLPISNPVLGKEKAVRVNRTYEYIEELTNDKRDHEGINREPIRLAVYARIPNYIKEGTDFFIKGDLSEEKRVSPILLYQKLSKLVERLENGIPPNSIDSGPGENMPATLAEIINASWFHKITWEESVFKGGIFNDKIYKKRNRMNNLTLKAIEYSNIEEEYKKHMKGESE